MEKVEIPAAVLKHIGAQTLRLWMEQDKNMALERRLDELEGKIKQLSPKQPESVPQEPQQ